MYHKLKKMLEELEEITSLINKKQKQMILEKRKLRLVSKRFKNILKNIIAFIIVSIGSVGLLMLGGLLDKI